ncbi:hypothetical protein V2G26_009216 [Clonostachys chloroleuca]
MGRGPRGTGKKRASWSGYGEQKGRQEICFAARLTALGRPYSTSPPHIVASRNRRSPPSPSSPKEHQPNALLTALAPAYLDYPPPYPDLVAFLGVCNHMPKPNALQPVVVLSPFSPSLYFPVIFFSSCSALYKSIAYLLRVKLKQDRERFQ